VTVYPLEDDVSGVAASGNVTPTASQTEAGAYIVRVNNIDSEQFVVDTDDTRTTIVPKITAAINAVLSMPVVATSDLAVGAEKTDLAAKWAGESGNDLFVEVLTPDTGAATFAITQPAGGLVKPCS